MRLSRQLAQRHVGGVEEARLQQEVLGRVAGQRELGEDDERGPLVTRAGDLVRDLPRVAADVPDRRIDLRESYPQQVRALRHVPIIAGAGPKQPH
jgi:hypothetical protein